MTGLIVVIVMLTLVEAYLLWHLRKSQERVLNAVADYIKEETAEMQESAACTPDGRCDPTPHVVRLSRLAENIGVDK